MVYFTQQGQELVCTFTGQVDTMAMMKDEPAVLEKVQQARDCSVAFDLAEVTFVASSFLRLCLKTAKVVGADRFAVRNVAPEIKRVFVIAGLDKLITIT